jgi:hypothetical protein
MSYAIINDVISQIESNFMCLHLWTFFSHYAMENNLSGKAKNIKLTFSDKRWFILSGYKIKDSLESIYIHQEKENFFSTFVEINAFRGILWAMLEWIEKDRKFKRWLEEIITPAQMDVFRYTLRFIRNILSHNIDPEMRLHEHDFRELQRKIVTLNSPSINNWIVDFQIDYEKVLPKSGIKNYKFQITVDFNTLKKGTPFYQLVPKADIYMLCEFCYNLIVYYKMWANL